MLILNSVLGLLMFEWAWAKTKPLREGNEARDSKYPAFRRYDALHWQKWKFYFGAITLMPIRFILTLLILILLFLIIK